VTAIQEETLQANQRRTERGSNKEWNGFRCGIERFFMACFFLLLNIGGQLMRSLTKVSNLGRLSVARGSDAK
jgi:hypothetical protein